MSYQCIQVKLDVIASSEEPNKGRTKQKTHHNDPWEGIRAIRKGYVF